MTTTKNASTTRELPAVLELMISAKSINETARTARFTASTEAVDSYGESVKQNWRLQRYLSNPIVLYNHQRFGTDLPIGKATVSQNGQGAPLDCEITFVTAKANPLAEQVWQSVIEGSLRAVSVGFRPHTVRMEMIDDEEVYVLDDNELYEISVTPLPANPEALAKAKALAREAAAPSHDNAPHASRAQETNMDGKDMQKALEDRAIELKTASDRIKQLEVEGEKLKATSEKLETSLAASAEREKTLTTERDTLTKEKALVDTKLVEVEKSLSDANAKLIDQEVEALVGEKITPAEKEEFVELRTTNPKLFTKMMEKRAPLGLKGKKMGADPDPKSSIKAVAGTQETGEELGSMLDAGGAPAADAPELGDLV